MVFKSLPVCLCLAIGTLLPGNTFGTSFDPKDRSDLNVSWNYFFDSSFLYWYAREEGLNLAESALLLQGNVVMAQEAISLGQSFEYQPGFKVGMGGTFNSQ